MSNWYLALVIAKVHCLVLQALLNMLDTHRSDVLFRKY